jgi:hypothetical protein
MAVLPVTAAAPASLTPISTAAPIHTSTAPNTPMPAVAAAQDALAWASVLLRWVPTEEAGAVAELFTAWILDPGSLLDDVSGRLVDALPVAHRKNRDHYLCEIIAAAEELTSPDTYTKALRDVLAKAMTEAGMHRVWARVAAGAAVASSNLLVSQLGSAQLQLGLSCIALMTCPNPDSCPQDDPNFSPFKSAGVQASLEVFIPLDVQDSLGVTRPARP